VMQTVALLLVTKILLSFLACKSISKSDVSTHDLPTSSDPIVVIVKAEVKQGTIDRLLQALPIVMLGTRNESGNVSYSPHSTLDNPHKLIFIEKWANEAALNAHRRKPHTESFFAKVATILAFSPVSEQFEIIAGQDKRIKMDGSTNKHFHLVSKFYFPNDDLSQRTLESIQVAALKIRSDPDNLGFEIYRSVSRKNYFVIYEVWPTSSQKSRSDFDKILKGVSHDTGGDITSNMASEALQPLDPLEEDIHRIKENAKMMVNFMNTKSGPPAPRDFHSKGFCSKGTLSVDPSDLPERLRVGLFAKAATYAMFGRFSNGTPGVKVDDRKPSVYRFSVQKGNVYHARFRSWKTRRPMSFRIGWTKSAWNQYP
jgi:quinol monooxygenase YgiN